MPVCWGGAWGASSASCLCTLARRVPWSLVSSTLRVRAPSQLSLMTPRSPARRVTWRLCRRATGTNAQSSTARATLAFWLGLPGRPAALPAPGLASGGRMGRGDIASALRSLTFRPNQHLHCIGKVAAFPQSRRPLFPRHASPPQGRGSGRGVLSFLRSKQGRTRERRVRSGSRVD